MQVRVRVRTGQKKESVVSLRDGRLLVSVCEKPKENRANARVVEMVARHMAVVSSRVRIISGHHTPAKTIQIQ